MSKAMQLVGIIIIGILTLAVINIVSDVQSNNELDYYLLQEVTEAAMYDAVDYTYYRETGLLKVDRDMFLESFNRRFAESVDNDRNYTIRIIDFNETPPKASVEVSAPTVASLNSEVAIVTNRVNGILETIYDDLVMSRGSYGKDDSDGQPPTINIDVLGNNEYKFTITDDYLLYRCAVVETINPGTKPVYSDIKEWINISEKTEYKKEYSFQKNINTATGKGYWIIAEDAGGNVTIQSITDQWPLVVPSFYENGILYVTLNDDNGIKGYIITKATIENGKLIAADADATDRKYIELCNPNTSKCSKQKDVQISPKDLGLETGVTYALFAVDNIGQYTKFEDAYHFTVYETKPEHQMTINFNGYTSISGTTATATLTFKDTWEDLYGYAITTTDASKEEDFKSAWTPISGGEVTIDVPNFNIGSTYRIWLKDNEGLVTYKDIPIKVENHLVTYPGTGDNQYYNCGANAECEYKTDIKIDCSKYSSVNVTLKIHNKILTSGGAIAFDKKMCLGLTDDDGVAFNSSECFVTINNNNGNHTYKVEKDEYKSIIENTNQLALNQEITVPVKCNAINTTKYLSFGDAYDNKYDFKDFGMYITKVEYIYR